MSNRAKRVTVGTTPTPLSTGTDSDSYPYTRDTAIANNSGATVYLGGEGVDVTDGYPLPTGQTITLTGASPLYAVTASGDADVNILDVGV